MLKTLVVTSWNSTLYDEYAHRFWHSFPHDELDLCVVSEDTTAPHINIHMRAQTPFVQRNSIRPVRGFKWDAVRFCYKPYAIWSVLQEHGKWGEKPAKYDRIVWLDADTVFRKTITEQWITDNIWFHDSAMSYMGRPNYHSETGLLVFNNTDTLAREFVEYVVELYNTDKVYELAEYHDSYVWDWARIKHERRRGKQKQFKFKDLAEHIQHKVQGGHIQARLYGDVMDHCKGKRKIKGYSPEVSLKDKQ